jgi:hypothetical protein
MAGYSGTPLARKLGLKPGMRVAYIAEKATGPYRGFLGQEAPPITLLTELGTKVELVHIFTASRDTLTGLLRGAMRDIAPNGMIWVSWPKKASKMPSDITEDTIRAVALPLGLVDVKVCAVDDTWSGLKLVIRKELR